VAGLISSWACTNGGFPSPAGALPIAFVKKHHDRSTSWEKLKLRNLDIEKFKNDKGFELIAKALSVDYPSRP
jgi:hypothetical protein